MVLSNLKNLRHWEKRITQEEILFLKKKEEEETIHVRDF